MKAFISYSHKDEGALERLHTHLAMLRRDGHIDEWYDREILAGDDINKEISEELESCELFLALISPDFLASNYCYETEMKRALERHDAGKVRVVPIIIEACDWKVTPLGKLKALPRDGMPIGEWTNQNTAYLDVVTELRRILVENERMVPPVVPQPAFESSSPDRRYRVKHDFDDIDRSDFRVKAYNDIRDYFISAVAEIDGIEGIRGRYTETSTWSFTCTVINKAMNRGTAHITVHASNGNMGMGDIYYSFSENAPYNTANGGFRVESDEYDLFLRPSMFTVQHDPGHDNDRLSAQNAAEMLWREFLEQTGITYD